MSADSKDAYVASPCKHIWFGSAGHTPLSCRSCGTPFPAESAPYVPPTDRP